MTLTLKGKNKGKKKSNKDQAKEVAAPVSKTLLAKLAVEENVDNRRATGRPRRKGGPSDLAEKLGVTRQRAWAILKKQRQKNNEPRQQA